MQILPSRVLPTEAADSIVATVNVEWKRVGQTCRPRGSERLGVVVPCWLTYAFALGAANGQGWRLSKRVAVDATQGLDTVVKRTNPNRMGPSFEYKVLMKLL